MARQAKQASHRQMLQRKLRDLIDHPGTEPAVRTIAIRKYKQLFGGCPPVADVQVFIVVERYVYPFPDLLRNRSFITIGNSFQRRSIAYSDIVSSLGDADSVYFYQRFARVIVVQYPKLIGEDALMARLVPLRLGCRVRHLSGFSRECQYQVNFDERTG